MSALLHVNNISKRFGGFIALDGIDLEVQPGERLDRSAPTVRARAHWSILHLQMNRQRAFDGHVIDGLAAHQRTHCGVAQLPIAAPVPQHDVGRQPAYPLAPYRACARRHAACAQRPGGCASARHGRAWRESRKCRDLTQVEMRKFELARAMAAEPKP